MILGGRDSDVDNRSGVGDAERGGWKITVMPMRYGRRFRRGGRAAKAGAGLV
jgi:hypothetical protein